MSRALVISSITPKFSPALGTMSSPEISTGADGPAVSIERPLSLKIAPDAARKPSPRDDHITDLQSAILHENRCEYAAALGKRDASRQVPVAGRVGSALSSCNSAIAPERGQEVGDPHASRGGGLDVFGIASPFHGV